MWSTRSSVRAALSMDLVVKFELCKALLVAQLKALFRATYFFYERACTWVLCRLAWYNTDGDNLSLYKVHIEFLVGYKGFASFNILDKKFHFLNAFQRIADDVNYFRNTKRRIKSWSSTTFHQHYHRSIYFLNLWDEKMFLLNYVLIQVWWSPEIGGGVNYFQ